jgi:hypothetical protein
MTNSSKLLWEEAYWFTKASNWIENNLSQQGIKPIASIQQFRIRHWSTILKIPTTIGDIYFKAAIPELAYEAALMETLSDYCPHSIPQILATSKEDGWLLMGDAGMMLREKIKTEDNIQHWQEVLSLYSQLQKDSVKHLDKLLKLGIYDRRLEFLPILYQEFVNDLLTNIEISPTNNPYELSLLECQKLQYTVNILTSLCQQLAAFGIPQTLHHGDLHDGNVYIQDGRYIFIDWGDSSISHPFFSLRDTYRCLKIRFKLEENSFWFQKLKDVYLAFWVKYETRKNLEVAFEIAQKLSPIPDILRWLPVLSNMDEATKNNYINFIPNLLREFLRNISQD